MAELQKYRVHIYAVVRVPVEVEAESQTEAIKKAGKDTDLFRMLDSGESEYAEEITGYLVDEQGDEEYERSLFYDADGKVARG